MFERFAEAFRPDRHSLPGPHRDRPLPDGLADVPGAAELVHRFGGTSFNRGLYRILPVENMDRWNQVAWQTWPNLDARFWVIAIDWHGRLYGIDYSTAERDERGWCMSGLVPHSGKHGEFGDDLIGFHDIRLVDRMNGAISSGYFAEWLEAGGDEPAFDQCVNQKIPYFLGGCADEVDDLELSDLDVYWHLSSQLICWARTVPKDKWENGVITVPVNITID